MLGCDRPQRRYWNKRKLCITDCLSTVISAFEEQMLNIENVASEMKRDNLPSVISGA